MAVQGLRRVTLKTNRFGTRSFGTLLDPIATWYTVGSGCDRNRRLSNQLDTATPGSSEWLRRPRFHHRPRVVPCVRHRHHEYDPSGFAILQDMQERHFWYRGRHRFLLDSVHRHARRDLGRNGELIDLGGGCGSWVAYLAAKMRFPTAELALADSSDGSPAPGRHSLARRSRDV